MRSVQMFANRIVRPARMRWQDIAQSWALGLIRLGLVAALVNGSLAAAPLEFIRVISPGAKVTTADIVDFNTRWMSAPALDERRNRYEDLMKNRLAPVWELGDDARAMVRMYELTRSEQYLNHLGAMAQITLRYRDDKHPGDGTLGESNPDCMRCDPPFTDLVRNGVKAAWGGGDYLNYVLEGGLNPVDAVTSGVLMYPIVAYARLIAESNDSLLMLQRGDDAVRAANAGIQVFEAFLPEFFYDPTDPFKVGTYYRPTRIPTDAECKQAASDAIDHLRIFDYVPSDPNRIADLTSQINHNKLRCELKDIVQGKPLAHNEAGSLMISFIELWRALDSDLYRRSDLAVANAEFVRNLIPFIVARNQRYFLSRLRLETDANQASRYWWYYLDDLDEVKDQHVEDTGHANLDLLSLSSVRNNLERLDAVTAAAGEPIAMNDVIWRRLANTFIQKVSKPLVDSATNLNCNVQGQLLCEKTQETPWVYNSVTDGWVQLAAVESTVYSRISDLAQRKTTREGNTGLNDLTIANHSALLGQKQYARETSNVDLSLWVSGVPPAVGDPSGWVYASQQIQDMAFRGQDGHVYELWRSLDGDSGIATLTAIANPPAPRAVGNPKGYEYSPAQAHNVAYRGSDDHVHVLWWTTGAVGHDNLTSAAGAPKAAGDPFPYVNPSPHDMQNVLYRGTDGHLHALYWSDGAVSHHNLTALTNASKPAGDAVGYFIPTQQIQNVVYRGADGHLHGIFWGPGVDGIHHENLTLPISVPLPSGDPVAFIRPDETQHVFYIGKDGRVHALYWKGADAVQHEDLSGTLIGVPLPVGKLNAYFSFHDARHHVVYRSSSRHLHDLSWTTGAISHVDLMTIATGPLADSLPAAYEFAGEKSQHVIYRTGNGDLQDISWTTPDPPDIIILRTVRSQ